MFKLLYVRLFLSFLLLVAVEVVLTLFLAYFELPVYLTVLVAVVIGAAYSILMTYLHYRTNVKPTESFKQAAKRSTNGEQGIRITEEFFDKDITALKNAYNEMASAFENLEQLRKQFVSNVSHELRSPLTSMQGFLQAILDGTISVQDRTKYLHIVYNETRRLSVLINSMLDLSRMEAGKSIVVFTRFELNELINKAMMRFEPDLTKKRMQFEVDFIKDKCYVYADKGKIEQVLINLVDNAIKYSMPETKITIYTQFHAKKVYIYIKDRGVGISKKDQALIWDRFYMSDTSRTPVVGKGTGLGLAIVKKIIDDHKELIWVESAKGTGSTFVFTLSQFDPTKHKIDIGKVPYV